jgi:hypothetical protein
MLKYVQTILSTLLVSTTVFLVACSGSDAQSGDRFEGTGTATVSQNGDIKGDGKGKSHSDRDGDVDGHEGNDGKDGDGGDDDDDSHKNRRYKLKNPTDKIVCTDATTGQITVHGTGDIIQKTTKATCVVTPANQVPTATTGSTSGSAGSTTGTTGSGSTTSTTGSGSTSSGTATTSAKNPANSY